MEQDEGYVPQPVELVGGGERWIIAQTGREIVNVASGVAFEALRDPNRSWVIRFHSAGMAADVAIADGDHAEEVIEAAFGKLVAWLVEAGEALVLADVLAEVGGLAEDVTKEPAP